MKKLFRIIFGFVLFILLLSWYFIVGNYSDGIRAGTIIKLSSKGVIFNTHEGQLNLGMIVSPNAAANGGEGQIWSFSVKNDAHLIHAMESAMLSGHRIGLHYKEKYFKFPWNGDSKYIVYEIEMLK